MPRTRVDCVHVGTVPSVSGHHEIDVQYNHYYGPNSLYKLNWTSNAWMARAGFIKQSWPALECSYSLQCDSTAEAVWHYNRSSVQSAPQLDLWILRGYRGPTQGPDTATQTNYYPGEPVSLASVVYQLAMWGRDTCFIEHFRVLWAAYLQSSQINPDPARSICLILGPVNQDHRTPKQ